LERLWIGEGIRALIRTRCDNMEEVLGVNDRTCVFCGEGQDNMEHFVSECSEVRERFRELGVCRKKD